MAIRQETSADDWAVEALFDQCFAPGRTALSSYRLRDGVPSLRSLCLVDEEYGAISGALRFWPVLAGGTPALLLGPLAVHPTRQGEGLGARLIQEGLASAERAGWARVLLVGDEPYYARLGFAILPDVTMPPPTNPERVLGWGDWQGISGPVTRWPVETTPVHT